MESGRGRRHPKNGAWISATASIIPCHLCAGNPYSSRANDFFDEKTAGVSTGRFDYLMLRIGAA
jgi:hypothetical protein